MKILVFLLLISTVQITSYAQSNYCDSLACAFYGDTASSFQLSHFCEGVEEALKTDYLAIRGLGDPDHLSNCEIYAYEAYGVKLQLTGDIVLSGQKEKNDGFNAVMIPRIKDSLGVNYHKLGKIDSSWIVLGETNLLKELASIFYHSPHETDSTFTIFIDSLALSTSTFKSFEGLTFRTVNQKVIPLAQFYSGAVIPKSTRNRAYIRMDFQNYLNPNHICDAYGRWIIPYPMVTYR